MSTHSGLYLSAAAEICQSLNHDDMESLARELVLLREAGGRLFFVGVGGSAGNCGHAVNDFRKLCGIEAYAPTDNVSELSARANDEGWETVFAGWLEISRLGSKDAVFVLSVGGGDVERNVSVNIVRAIDYAKSKGAKVFGIVGKSTGYTAAKADICVVVPTPKAEWITPLSEAFQAVIWHGLVSHPQLQVKSTKW